jgi:hypothetical protein
MEQLKTSMKDKITQMQDVRKKMSEQMKSDTVDQSSMDNIIDQKVKIIGDIMKTKAKAKKEVMDVLNADQKQKIKSMMMKMEDKMAEKYKECHDHD